VIEADASCFEIAMVEIVVAKDEVGGEIELGLPFAEEGYERVGLGPIACDDEGVWRVYLDRLVEGLAAAEADEVEMEVSQSGEAHVLSLQEASGTYSGLPVDEIRMVCSWGLPFWDGPAS